MRKPLSESNQILICDRTNGENLVKKSSKGYALQGVYMPKFWLKKFNFGGPTHPPRYRLGWDLAFSKQLLIFLVANTSATDLFVWLMALYLLTYFVDLTTLPRQISPQSVQHVTPVGEKNLKIAPWVTEIPALCMRAVLPVNQCLIS